MVDGSEWIRKHGEARGGARPVQRASDRIPYGMLDYIQCQCEFEPLDMLLHICNNFVA